MQVLKLLAVAGFLFTGAAQATTINVPADQPTIQAAINAASNGDTVLVAPGTYYEQLNFNGKAITVTSSGGAASTVLDGNGAGPIVTFDTSEGTGSVLQGFTLTHATDSAVVMSYASPTIEDNIFTANTSTKGLGDGDVVLGVVSSALILRNQFLKNQGTGVTDTSDAVVSLSGGSPVVADNVFTNNYCIAYFDQTLPSSGSPQLYNNTFVGNNEALDIVAKLSDAPAAFISNNLVYGNSIGIVMSEGALPFTNNLVSYNGADNYVGLSDQTGKNGNISVYPGVVDPSGGDVHLTYVSSAIDAGDSTVSQASATDVFGNARVVAGKPAGSAVVDIGAVEYQPPTVIAVDGDLVLLPSATKYGTLSSSSTDAYEPLTFALDTLPSHGTVTQPYPGSGTLGSEIKYVASPGYLGTDSFTFHVVDPYGNISASATEHVSMRYPITINVPADQPTIKAAMESSGDGDTIVVAPGTYYEQLDFKGKAITVESSDGAAVTILDANGGIVLVSFTSGESNASVLQGFTLTHAHAAVVINSSSPTIEDDIFSDDIDDSLPPVSGGELVTKPFTASAIMSDDASPIIIRNTFVDNTSGDAQSGSGWVLAFLNGGPVVADNLFLNDSATACLMLTGYPFGAGGTLYFYNNTMVGNAVGVAVGEGAYAFISNNLLAYNQVAFSDPSSSTPYPPQLTFTNNLVYENTTADYQGVTSPNGTNGNISADPLLADWADGDVHLLSGSPAIDAGDSTVTQSSATDLYGAPRVVTGIPDSSPVVDIGAAEYSPIDALGGALALQVDVAKSGVMGYAGGDAAGPLVFAAVAPPAHGSLSITDPATGAFTYTPAQGYVGPDSFTFHITDPYGDVSNTATELLSVTDPAPAANAGNVTTVVSTVAAGQLSSTLAYTGQVIEYTLIAKPRHGGVSLSSSTGQFRYTPQPGFVGSDSFSFQVVDAYGTSSRIATESITVNDVAAAAESATIRLARSRLYHSTLQAKAAYLGQTFTYSVVSGASHGTVTILDARHGTFTYQPASGYQGTDSFTFNVVDQWGTSSNTATVTFNVK